MQDRDAFASPFGGTEALSVLSVNGGGVVDRDAAERPRGDAGGRGMARGGAGYLEARPVALADVPVPNPNGGGVSRREVRDSRRARLGIGQPAVYNWRVEDVLPDGAYAFIYGRFGAFKSLVSLDMAERIARGMPLLWGPDGPGEYRVESGPVLYVAAEDYGGIELRRQAWESHHGVGETPMLEVASRPVNLTDEEAVADLAAYVLEQQIKLVIIDTLHRSMRGGSEVSDVDTAMVTAAVERLQGAYYPSPEDVPVDPSTQHEAWMRTSFEEVAPDWVTPDEDRDGMALRSDRFPHWSGMPAVLLVHHPNQRTNTLRGHGGFYGDSDTIYRMTRRADRTSELYCEKQKNAADGWSLRLEFVKVGRSGVVVPVEGSVESSRKAYGSHVRWHKNRGVVDPECRFCREDASSMQSGEVE
jgi:hypothetical protein